MSFFKLNPWDCTNCNGIGMVFEDKLRYNGKFFEADIDGSPCTRCDATGIYCFDKQNSKLLDQQLGELGDGA